jgi:Tfp pilus assembly protein PilN
MTQVNLLPVEVNERVKSRRITTVIAAGAGAALILLGFVFLVQASRLSSVNHQLVTQQAEDSRLQSQVTQLQHYAQLKQQVAEKQAMVTSITAHQVEWSGVLRDLSMVIPGDVWLTSFQGTLANSQAGTSATPSGPATPAAPGTSFVGNLQFNGGALSHPDVALWLTRLQKIDGWVNPWISSSVAANGSVTFQGTTDLTNDVATGGRQ